MANNAVGFYRAEIAGVDDPEERYRYRVRVNDFHDDNMPADHLPFASLAVFVGVGFGDVPHFEIGDKVVVVFERGCLDHPIIMGGWVTGDKTNTGVVPHYPDDQSEPYADRRKQWDRQDRSGNRVRLVEDTAQADETSLELHSVNQIQITTEQGNLNVEINGDGSVTVSGDLTLNVQGDMNATIQGDMNATIQGNAEVQAVGSVEINSSDIRLGTTPSEQVVTEQRLKTVFDTHVHPDPVSGNTGPPVAPIVPGSISSAEVTAS